MGHIKHCAAVAVDGVLQDFLTHDIQMVRWLIQNQEICFRQHQLGQRHTSPFPAGKHLNLLEHIVPGKKKRCQNIPDFRICERGILIRDFLKQRFVRMQHMMLLIIISDMYLCPQPDIPGILFHKPVDDF